MSKGFISIPIIIAIIIVSLTSGVVVRHRVLSKKKVETTLPPPIVNPYSAPSISSDKSDKSSQIQSQNPAPKSPSRNTNTTNSTSTLINIQQKFALLEGELQNAQEKKTFFSPEHTTRILSDLTNLEAQGYPKSEIERLRGIVYNFSPYLEDQKKQNPVAPSPYMSAAQANCQSNSNPVFINDITDISKVNYIGPPPTMGAGPSLKTHSYIGTDHARVPVYAPATMTLESGSHSIGGPYMMEFRVSCEVKVRFGHITEPVEAIRKLLPTEPKQDSRTEELAPIVFPAGEIVGYTTGTDLAGNWDFGVYNSTVRNRYADDPDWGNSTTYTTAVCPFDYFTASLRSTYFSKFNSAALGGNPPHGVSFCGI